MAGGSVYLPICLMPSPRFELQTLADCNIRVLRILVVGSLLRFADKLKF